MQRPVGLRATTRCWLSRSFLPKLSLVLNTMVIVVIITIITIITYYHYYPHYCYFGTISCTTSNYDHVYWHIFMYMAIVLYYNYNWGVPKIGVPINHSSSSILDWDFPLQNIHVGVPPFMEPPNDWTFTTMTSYDQRCAQAMGLTAEEIPKSFGRA